MDVNYGCKRYRQLNAKQKGKTKNGGNHCIRGLELGQLSLYSFFHIVVTTSSRDDTLSPISAINYGMLSLLGIINRAEVEGAVLHQPDLEKESYKSGCKDADRH